MNNNHHAIVLFDGDCSFCKHWVKFIRKRSKNPETRFLSLQSNKGVLLLNKYKLPTNIQSVIFIKGSKAYTKSSAVMQITGELKGMWFLLKTFYIIPSFIRNPLYDFVAKHRHKLITEDDSCELPED